MEEYWIGPYDIRVPMKYEIIIAADGVNTKKREGGPTEMGVRRSLTKEQYLAKYTELKADGYHWYKGNNS
jgi:hypothetical protein